MIHDPVSEVVGDIKCNLSMPLKARPKRRVSSAAKDTMGCEENENHRLSDMEREFDHEECLRMCVSLEARNRGRARASAGPLVGCQSLCL